MLKDWQKEKIEFVEEMNNALKFVRLGGKARYEFWKNEFGDLDEFLVIDYGKGSIDIRNCSGNSCFAILQELTELLKTPKWTEVSYYKENYLNNPKARLVDPDEDLLITAVNDFSLREYETDKSSLLQNVPEDGIIHMAYTSYEEEEGSPEIQVDFDCYNMSWKSYIDGKLVLTEPRESFKQVAEEIESCNFMDLISPVHDLIRKD